MPFVRREANDLGSFSCKLQVYMTDNDAGERSFTRARFRLVNTNSLSRKRANRSAPQSTYVWTLDDPSMIGMPDVSVDEGAKVFAIALSMQTQRFLHSPVILSTVAVPAVERSGPDFLVGGIRTVLSSPGTGSHPNIIDERKFAAAARCLRTVWSVRSSRGDILRESLNSYWDALHTVQRRGRILSLWAAFERAINDDGERRPGKKFDRHAARATGIEAQEIGSLRDLTRFLKHADVVVKPPADVTESIASDSRRIKELADRAIAARLDIELPVTYTR